MGDVVERTTSLGHSARWISNVCGLPERVIPDGKDEVASEFVEA
ncbi:hypothetical protein [Sorangium sp. So ce117]